MTITRMCLLESDGPGLPSDQFGLPLDALLMVKQVVIGNL